MASLTLSSLLLTRLDQTSTVITAAVDIALGGFGMGMMMAPMLIAVQSAVSKRDLGAATSLTHFFRSIGGAVGVSVMGAVMAHRLQTELGVLQRLAGDDVTQRFLYDLIRDPASRLQGLAQARQALAQALHGVFVVGLIVCILALVSAFLFVPPGRAQELARRGGQAEAPERT
jgi:MFS family permease